VRDGVAAYGEIGLTGRLRAATQADRRAEECRKFGISSVVGPRVETLRQALGAALADSAD
jgi:predicted ATP-dependent serine protease